MQESIYIILSNNKKKKKERKPKFREGTSFIIL